MSHIWVSADALHQWTRRSLEAQSLFPELIRSLVHAAGRQVTHAAFPIGKSIQLAGWDGTLACGEATAFVQRGSR